jgi:hypothetical protein
MFTELHSASLQIGCVWRIQFSSASVCLCDHLELTCFCEFDTVPTFFIFFGTFCGPLNPEIILFVLSSHLVLCGYPTVATIAEI